MDIQQPPRGSNLDDPAMQRWLQDAYNGVKCPLFRAKITGGHWTIPAIGFNIVPFNTIDFAPLGGYDNTNYRWSPKVPGYYQLNVTGSLYFQFADLASCYVWICFAANGSTILNGIQISNNNLAGGGNSGIPFSNTLIHYMNGLDDYVDVRIYKSVASTHLLLANQVEQYPIFQSFKLTY